MVRCRERGAALAELAVLLPFLALLLGGLMKVGVSFYHQIALSDAARAVARASSDKLLEEDICNTALAAFNRSLTTSGLDPEHFSLRVTTPADTGSGGLLYFRAEVTVDRRAQGILHLRVFEPSATATFPLLRRAERVHGHCNHIWNNN
jgi:Flp pilus assembly protein TadG